MVHGSCTAVTSSGGGSCIILLVNKSKSTGGCLPTSLNKTFSKSDFSLPVICEFLPGAEAKGTGQNLDLTVPWQLGVVEVT